MQDLEGSRQKIYFNSIICLSLQLEDEEEQQFYINQEGTNKNSRHKLVAIKCNFCLFTVDKSENTDWENFSVFYVIF